MARKDEESPISKQVREELESDIYVNKAIRLGIANCSAIAKNLSQKVGGSEDALKMAVLRYSRDVCKRYEEESIDVAGVLGQTKITLISNVCVLVFERSPATHAAADGLGGDDEIFSILASQKVVLVMTSDENEKYVVDKLGRENIIQKTPSLCMLRLTSPSRIENVPGVIAHVLDQLSQHGINIVDLYSCYTDTNIVIERNDALKAFELLEKMCRKRMPAAKKGR
jgi:hypothetical protein